MQFILLDNKKSGSDGNGSLLRCALSNQPIAAILSRAIRDTYIRQCEGTLVFGGNDAAGAYPEELGVARFDPQQGLPLNGNIGHQEHDWQVITNGGYACKANYEWLFSVINDLPADLITVNLQEDLCGYHEQYRLASNSQLVGCRRYYSDSIEPGPLPTDWPHHVFMRTSVLSRLASDGYLPADFEKLISKCTGNSLQVLSLNAAGSTLDLETEEGLLVFALKGLSGCPTKLPDKVLLPPGARLAGPVRTGRNVTLKKDAAVIGPAIICDNVTIGAGAIVGNSIIGPGVSVPPEKSIRNRVLVGNGENATAMRSGPSLQGKSRRWSDNTSHSDYFRTWPRLSYPRYFKRIFDIVAAIMVLGLFLPFFPIIILAIKLSSPGPIFYKARRQGLGGKEFDCLKFRSMMPTAEDMQDKLRFVSQVDGPQFKMEHDPRVNAVGRFLRQTNIDEIPQFINVLKGEMSIMGPRPSPEHENTGCPHWRYARLSVRPGITGLWQISRTRQEGRDFQEWIHYDVEYVRRLSFWTDVGIFWKTASYLVNNFIDQF
jgi:lipopolysaccharide/colanic/teichoic acid biosynthesis glycosyltransferase